MMAIGAWDALVESARADRQLYRAGPRRCRRGAGRRRSAFAGQQWGLLFLLALIGLVLAIRRFNRRSLWWIVVVWLIAGTAIMLVQLKFYDYHWLPMLPPLALIGAGVIEAVIACTISRVGATLPDSPLQRHRDDGCGGCLALLRLLARA